MIAVDTNILVYAHRQDSLWHQKAWECMALLAEGNQSWGIPWPCVHEFISVITNTRIFKPATPLDLALSQVEAWQESPTMVMLSEPPDYWLHFRKLTILGLCTGGMVHDARIAALCAAHQVKQLWSADRDFTRFPQIRLHNPLL